jgi:hypothetical protein
VTKFSIWDSRIDAIESGSQWPEKLLPSAFKIDQTKTVWIATFPSNSVADESSVNTSLHFTGATFKIKNSTGIIYPTSFFTNDFLTLYRLNIPVGTTKTFTYNGSVWAMT